MSIIGTDIEQAGKYLRRGELVAIPTETVYGLAANGLDAKAVAGIFEAKNRPTFDPLILHVASLKAALSFLGPVPDLARRLAEAFWPGPLTLILEKNHRVPALVTAGLATVGVRVPAHPMTLALLGSLDFPLAAPSANPFGYVSPTTPQHVAAQLGERVPYILDGGSCRVGIESTIVSLQSVRPAVLRLGGLSIEDIEAVAGPVDTCLHTSSNPLAPGMLQSHYAPRKPLRLGSREALDKQPRQRESAYLLFDNPDNSTPESNVFYLSPCGDLQEAARELFGYLRALDDTLYQEIRAELLPDKGLGSAINDRLRRAAFREETSGLSLSHHSDPKS